MNAAKPSPRILVDGFFFQLGRTGIARVWQSLLREWAANGFAEHLLVLDRGDTMPRLDGVNYLSVPAYDYRTSGADALQLQALCDREQADLFVSTYYTAPLTTPSLFVAYDMIPEVFNQELEGPMWREKHHGVQHASAHVAISQSTARDLARFFPTVAAESVTVAYPGIETLFHPATNTEIEQFRERHGLQKPYFLLVGSRAGVGGYKNALLFFQAFAALRERRRFAIVCAGGAASLEPQFQPLVEGVQVQRLDLSDEELRAAYSGAIALAYPSRYEGFGLPVLEALACGCPVLTCRNSSLIEVAGDAAVYVPEDDAGAMTAALQQVQEGETRRFLIAAGLRQATKFSWRDMAAKLADAMRRTATAARPPLPLWSEFRRIQAVAQERPALDQRLQRADYELKQTEVLLKQTDAWAKQCEEKIKDLEAEVCKNYWELKEVRELVAVMQESRFWKMRNALATSKKAVLRLASQCLPRRAG